MSKGLIVSGGHVDYDLLLRLLKNKYDYVMAVDHGMDALWVLNYTPDVMVGDFDSCESLALDHFRRQDVPEVKFMSEKDMTDTDLAIEHMIRMGVEETLLVGGTGTRFDHSLANVMMLLKYEDQIKIVLVDKTNMIRCASKHMTIAKEGFDYLSLLPLSDEVTGVQLRGVAYPLEDHTLLKASSFAVSNEIVEETCELTFDTGKLIVVQSRD